MKSNEELKQENKAIRKAQTTPKYWINGYRLMAKEVAKTHWREYLSSMAVTSTNIPEPLSPMIIKWTGYSERQNKYKRGNQLSFTQGHSILIQMDIKFSYVFTKMEMPKEKVLIYQFIVI